MGFHYVERWQSPASDRALLVLTSHYGNTLTFHFQSELTGKKSLIIFFFENL